MKREDDGSCEDGSDPEVAAPSVSRVSSSTNGNGSSTAPTPLIIPGTTSNVISSSPLRRQRELEVAERDAFARAALGNSLVVIGQQIAAQAAQSVPSLGLVGNNGSDGGTRGLPNITAILDTLGARATLASELSRRHHRTSSKKSSGGSSEGSNSTSPLSLNMVSGGGKPGPKPRAADSPGSGSTTSTTGVGNRDRVFRCNICDRSFGYKHVLQNHERTHTGEKPFQCTECNKRFTRDHHLKTHMRLHTGEKPYQCDHCDRQFVQVANLRRHLRVHTGERPYSCEMCDSKFSDSNQLKAHNLIHRGEKPFDCSKCQGKFRRRHHLMHHKCPKDEANVGRPRRGRRPRAYDSPLNHSPTEGMVSPHHFLGGQSSPVSPSSLHDLIQPSSISSTSHHLRHGSTSQLLAASAAGASGHNLYPFQIPNLPHLPSLLTTAGPLTSPREHYQRTLNSAFGQAASSSAHSLPPSAHSVSGPSSTAIETKTSRRKPKPPTRILTQQQRELFLKDRNTMQTQPLNMSVSAASSKRSSNNGDRLRSSLQRYKSSATYGPGGLLSRGEEDGQEVLDLSRSRSDFDSEPEEERMEDEDDDDTVQEDEDRIGGVGVDDEEMMEDDMGSYPDEDEDGQDNPQDLSNNNINSGSSGESGKITGPVLATPGNGIAYLLVKNESVKRNGNYE